MPVLSNAKHEIFAQGIAAGKSPQDAYVEAGYKWNKTNPYTIKKKKEIYERINELLLERQGAVLKKTAKEAEYTRDTLLGYLEEARAIALDKSNAVAVVSATIGMARILGLIIDRREVGDVGAFDHMTDEELVLRGYEEGARAGHRRAAFGRGRQQEVALARAAGDEANAPTIRLAARLRCRLATHLRTNERASDSLWDSTAPCQAEDA